MVLNDTISERPLPDPPKNINKNRNLRNTMGNNMSYQDESFE